MVAVTVERTVHCEPEEFLALVMDPERYATVADKLGPVSGVRREGDVTEFRSRLPGFPVPGPTVVSRMRLTPGERVDIGYAPLPRNRLVRRFSVLSASFVCTRVPEGTRVRRSVAFGFVPSVRWLVEPVLRRTLRADVDREIDAAKRLLESGRF